LTALIPILRPVKDPGPMGKPVHLLNFQPCHFENVFDKMHQMARMRSAVGNGQFRQQLSVFRHGNAAALSGRIHSEDFHI